jgi:hypothetical protein
MTEDEAADRKALPYYHESADPMPEGVENEAATSDTTSTEIVPTDAGSHSWTRHLSSFNFIMGAGAVLVAMYFYSEVEGLDKAFGFNPYLSEFTVFALTAIGVLLTLDYLHEEDTQAGDTSPGQRNSTYMYSSEETSTADAESDNPEQADATSARYKYSMSPKGKLMMALSVLSWQLAIPAAIVVYKLFH